MTAEQKGNAGLDRSFLEADIDELIGKMTAEEKISVLAGKNWWETVPVPRLNIPSVKVSDGPNGARGGSFFKMTKAAALPNETCMASSFSTDLIREAGGFLAEECKARGAVCLLGPTMNIQRSPLGGRAFESFSEDPTLSGTLASAYVNGLQSAGVSACVKHFVGNDQEHERNGEDSIIGQRALREIYLRPFQIAQKHAGPWAVMASYNKVNGTHVSESKALLRDILRKEWEYDGLVVSDWYGTYSVSEALEAGLSLEMPGPTLWRQPRMIQHLVTSHKITMRTVNARVREVLSWAQRLTQLNPDIVYAPPSPERSRSAPEEVEADKKILRRLAGEGVVLLKNEGNALPIREGRVAVIGPNAKARVITGGGSAILRPLWSVTPWEGMEENKPDAVDLSYSLGLQGAKFLPELDECFTTLDGKKGFNLEHYPIDQAGNIATEPSVHDTHDVSDMFLADFRDPRLGVHFVTEVKAKFTSPITGRYEFGLVVTGKGWLYLDDQLLIDNSKDQVMGTRYFGNGTIEKKGNVQVEKGKTYTLRVVHDSRRTHSGVAGTPFVVKGIRVGAFPLVDPAQAIEDAVATARAADKVVLVAGLNSDWESEGYDRPTLSLPLNSDELITRVAEANPNTVVVVQSGSAVSMPWVDKVAGVVQAWYGGNEAGNGIADVIYGKRNPSGRLPLSFPKREQDIAAALNFKSARTKVHYDEGIWVGYKHHNARGIAPLFPFGHGLSYTSFKYSDLAINVTRNKREWSASARVTVTNTGKVAGDHSVHFYTAPPPETPTGLRHPEVTLQAFGKVYDLQPGQSSEVQITLDKYAISHWDELDGTWKAEVGDWALKIGQDAQTMVAEVPFTVDDEMPWAKL